MKKFPKLHAIAEQKNLQSTIGYTLDERLDLHVIQKSRDDAHFLWIYIEWPE